MTAENVPKVPIENWTGCGELASKGVHVTEAILIKLSIRERDAAVLAEGRRHTIDSDE
jgi:hypothetical protein